MTPCSPCPPVAALPWHRHVWRHVLRHIGRGLRHVARHHVAAGLVAAAGCCGGLALLHGHGRPALPFYDAGGAYSGLQGFGASYGAGLGQGEVLPGAGIPYGVAGAYPAAGFGPGSGSYIAPPGFPPGVDVVPVASSGPPQDVPEPGSLAVLAVGIAGVLALRRRPAR